MPAELSATLEIRPYARRYRRATMRLVSESFQVHTHLDWQPVDEWLDNPNVLLLLAWRNNVLQGAMAAAEVLGGATWLRLVAVDDFANPGEVIGALWAALRQQLVAAGAREVGVLLLRSWLGDHLPPLGFSYCEDIITMRRYSADPPPPFREDIRVRNAYWNDIATVVDVDHAAFAPLWRMPRESLRQASRLAASFTIAELSGRAVGYQLTTQHADGAHLARLAVLPGIQGQGIGGALVGTLLRQFLRRGVLNMSVNTQQTNEQSQHVYFRYGFQRTMQDLPFWKIVL